MLSATVWGKNGLNPPLHRKVWVAESPALKNRLKDQSGANDVFAIKTLSTELLKEPVTVLKAAMQQKKETGKNPRTHTVTHSRVMCFIQQDTIWREGCYASVCVCVFIFPPWKCAFPPNVALLSLQNKTSLYPASSNQSSSHYAQSAG